MEPLRMGIGYDVHELVPGRKCILGGVEIPFDKGLLGHSDADVLIHAMMDALLGALAMGDIGHLFPDTDPAYKDCDSTKLLARVAGVVDEAGYRIGNIDSIIVAQKPKCAPYIGAMRKRVAQVLAVDENRISIKATTEEGLGFTGREEGIAAKAVACVVQK
jgi:2-C-methyl-D-erythritol 2,4-cyclodiphosphate synthase